MGCLKLLFDENLSPKLVARLADIYPDSAHVDRLGLGSESDQTIWDYAKQNDFVLVSKDADFHEKSVLFGHPPKFVWIRQGNCSVAQLEFILRNKADEIRYVCETESLSYFIIF